MAGSGTAARPVPVEFAQHVDRGEQRGHVGAGGVAGQRQRGQHGRGEGTQVPVAGGEQFQVTVIAPWPVRVGPHGGLQTVHPDAGAYQSANLLVGYRQVGEDFKNLVEQPTAVHFRTGPVEHASCISA